MPPGMRNSHAKDVKDDENSDLYKGVCKFRSKTRQFPVSTKLFVKTLRISSKTSGLREEMESISGACSRDWDKRVGLNMEELSVPSLKNPHWLTWRVPEACEYAEVCKQIHQLKET